MFKKFITSIRNFIILVLLFILFIFGFKFFNEFLTFRKIIHNLKAESRIAEVLVVSSELDEFTRKYTTTIKFLEYDVHGKPLAPRYFTFKGNLIQFETLVVRFDDKYIEEGHRMKGKSIYLFWKAFVLDGKNTQEFIITPIENTSEHIQKSRPVSWWGKYAGWFAPPALNSPPKPEYLVPDGYRVGNPPNYFEREIWERFWSYALSPSEREKVGIKNCQVEAPGSVFVPGTIYTLVIEHHGGIRIDTRPIPEILKN
jgi:hypothetical protein